MKRLILWMALLSTASGMFAQKKNFEYKIYGQVRADLFYNTRANEETVDGLFYMYPKDIRYDANHNDLNATPNGSLYVLYTRLGLDVKGPMIGNAKTSAKVEMDFRGAGSNFSLIRLRQAYLNLSWEKANLLVGQTWHPLFGDVSPQILNLATGAPFQPFGRAPMVRFQYQCNKVRFTAAAIWQSQFKSAGPAGKSIDYLKYGCVPEFYVGADYRNNGWIAGAGVEVLSLKPRKQSEVEERVYKVNERVTSVSGEAHLKYVDKDYMVAAKTILASNLTHMSMLGGYGITAIDSRTGEMEYTPMRHSSTWVNAVYGNRWKPGIFMGYTKNLGTKKALVSNMCYGIGTDVDQLMTCGAELTYNLPHWKFGAEYMFSNVWYGDLNRESGKIDQTHTVNNHRVVVSALFMF